MGVVIEAVKSIVNMILQQIVNTVVQPMLSGQTTSLNDLFDGESPDTITSNGMMVIPSLGSTLNSESSILSTVGSSIQTLMSAGSAFSGAGTILEPLISLTGPGIMSTLFDMVGNIILNSLIMPLVSQFNDTSLENALDNLTSSFGGLNNCLLQAVNLVGNVSSLTDQSGVTHQQYGSGITTQSTGSSDPTGGMGYNLQSLPTATTTNGVSPASSDALLNWLIQAGNFVNSIILKILDDTTGLFSPLVNIIGIVLNGIEKLISSSSDAEFLSIGILATFNNLFGALKMHFPKNSIWRPIIQLGRLILDAFQTEITFQVLDSKFTNNLLNDIVLSNIWIIKSISMTGSDFISFLNDYANENQIFMISMQIYLTYMPLWIWHIVGKDVGKFSHLAQATLELGSAIGVGLAYLNNIGSMNAAQKIATAGLIFAFLGEIFGKSYINYENFKNPNNDNEKTKEKLYLGEAGTEVIQIVFTFADLTAD